MSLPLWVEKVGGTSVSATKALLKSVIRVNHQTVKRVLVVSAHQGMTDLLLENKHTHQAGVFVLFKQFGAIDEQQWLEALEVCRYKMKAINAEVLSTPHRLEVAHRFVDERVNEVTMCLRHIAALSQFGHFQLAAQLDQVQELLCALGEAHSALTTYLLSQEQAVLTRWIDLTGWRNHPPLSFEHRINQVAELIEQSHESLVILTGYCHCKEGMLGVYGRGYSEITFAALACKLEAEKVILHKSVFLSSADPRWVSGYLKPLPCLTTGLAQALAHYGMEAIHPTANCWLTKKQRPLWIKHINFPEEPGTQVVKETALPSGVQVVIGAQCVIQLTVSSQDFILNIQQRMAQIQSLLSCIDQPILGTEFGADRWACVMKSTPDSLKLNTWIQTQDSQVELSVNQYALVALLGSHLQKAHIIQQVFQVLSDATIPLISWQIASTGDEIQLKLPMPFYKQAINELHQTLVLGLRQNQPIAESLLA